MQVEGGFEEEARREWTGVSVKVVPVPYITAPAIAGLIVAPFLGAKPVPLTSSETAAAVRSTTNWAT